MPPQYLVLPKRGSPYLQPALATMHDTVRCVIGPYMQASPLLVYVKKNVNPRWQIAASLLADGMLFIAIDDPNENLCVKMNPEYSMCANLLGNAVVKVTRDVNLDCFRLLETPSLDEKIDYVEEDGQVNLYQESPSLFSYNRLSIW